MNGRRRQRFAVLLHILFWAALAFALAMAFDPQPPRTGLERYGDELEHMVTFGLLTFLKPTGLAGYNDKVQHMLTFGVLTFLAQLIFRYTPRWRIAERLSFLGALIEVVQALPILHRDCDIRDWIADTIVIVMVTALFVVRDKARGKSRGQVRRLRDGRLPG
jgi:hypothetical protein